MRVFKVFTVVQILSVAEIGRPNLRKYMKFLLRAGYLRIARPKQNGKSEGHTVWRLVRSSGPKHPLPRRDGSGVYDPNHDALYPYSEEASTHDG